MKSTNTPMLLLGSLIILVVAWIAIIVNADDAIQQLSQVSASVRNINASGNMGLVITIGISGSFICILLSSILLSKNPSTFIALWLFTLAFAEAQIPAIAQISLVFRYSMMASLISAGLISLTRTGPEEPIHWAALFVLVLMIFQLLLNPSDTNAYLLIPMHIAMFLGVFFGLYPIAKSETALSGLIGKLATVGLVIIVINLMSLGVGEQPFLGGRFRSWYPLPTNFSNNFVLSVIPVFWALLTTRSPALRLVYTLACLAACMMLILAGTRNAMLVVGLSILQFSYFWKRRYFIYIAIVLLVLALAAITLHVDLGDMTPAGSRLANIEEKETRYFVWERALNYIGERPILGYGLSTDLASLDHRLPIWEQFNAHNAYLGLWLRLGIFGAILYLYIYWCAFKNGFSTIIRGRSSKRPMPLLILFQCLLLNLFVAGLFEENLSSRASIHQAIWAIAVVVIMGQSQLERERLRLARSSILKALPTNKNSIKLIPRPTL